MTDHLSPEKRSWNMSRIRSRDTGIEMKVRKYLFSKGFRYRVNAADLPGRPDLVLRKYMTVIFVHGCFWHRHKNCRYATLPKTRTDYWQAKFARNADNDAANQAALTELGMHVIVIWECQINKEFDEIMRKVVDELAGRLSCPL